MTRKRVIATGSRGWTDRATILEAVRKAYIHLGDFVLVHGDCPTGADAIAAKAALVYLRHPAEPHPADWERHGRRAGPIRNAEMVNLGADLCLAFIGPCTSPRCDIPSEHPSHGASGCADLAENAGIPTWRYGIGAESTEVTN